jgi:polysaccharide biosynthesis protein PslG
MRRQGWVIAGGAGLLVAAVLLVVILTRSGSGRPAGPLSPGIGVVGVNVNRVFDDRIYTLAQEAALARALAATGVDTARSDTFWELTEPQPPRHGVHRFDWSFDDGIAGTLAAAGLRWLPIVDYSAGWARARFDLLHSPPGNPALYAAFTTALARRYGPGGSFWAEHPELPRRPVRTYEIWNEPDTPLFWSPAPSAAAYARLYAAARAAIHAVDPAAMVLVGGLTHPVAFLPALVAADPALRSAIDGVAIHPYADSTAAVLHLVSRARTALRGLGLAAVPLYLTEFGWVTSPPAAHHYIPAASRPGLVRATVAALGHTDCGLAGEILYTWVTPRGNPADPEDWYGLEPPGGGPSADADALAQGARQARAPGPLEPVCG